MRSNAKHGEGGVCVSDIERRFNRLRLYNMVMGFIPLAQGAVLVALAESYKVPVTAQ